VEWVHTGSHPAKTRHIREGGLHPTYLPATPQKIGSMSTLTGGGGRAIIFERFESEFLAVGVSSTLAQIIIGYPHTDGGVFTISGNLKSFEGPVLKCRDSRNHRACYLNELVIHEIRNIASAIFQDFLFRCCEIEFVQLW
jgi:hypothetical protein